MCLIVRRGRMPNCTMQDGRDLLLGVVPPPSLRSFTSTPSHLESRTSHTHNTDNRHDAHQQDTYLYTQLLCSIADTDLSLCTSQLRASPYSISSLPLAQSPPLPLAAPSPLARNSTDRATSTLPLAPTARHHPSPRVDRASSTGLTPCADLLTNRETALIAGLTREEGNNSSYYYSCVSSLRCPWPFSKPTTVRSLSS